MHPAPPDPLNVVLPPAEQGNQSEGGAQLKVLSVEEGASVVFSGDVMVNGVEDNGSVFDNYGSME